MKSVIIPCPLCGRASSPCSSHTHPRTQNKFLQAAYDLMYFRANCPSCGISFNTSRIQRYLHSYKQVPLATERQKTEIIHPVRSYAMDTHTNLKVAKEHYTSQEHREELTQATTPNTQLVDPKPIIRERIIETDFEPPRTEPESGFSIKLTSRTLGLHIEVSLNSNTLRENIGPLIRKTTEEIIKVGELIASIGSEHLNTHKYKPSNTTKPQPNDTEHFT